MPKDDLLEFDDETENHDDIEDIDDDELDEELDDEDEDEEEDEDEGEDSEDDNEGEDDDDESDEDEDEDDEESEEDEEGDEDEEDDDEGDLDDDDDDDDVDEDIEEAASLTPEATEWFKKATENGKVGESKFLAKWVQQGKDIEELTKHEIFSEDDLYDKFEHVMEGHDPNRDLVPLSNDQEGWDKFNEKYWNVPRDTEGYEDTLFIGADGQYRGVADTEEKREQYRNYFYRESLSKEQAQSYLQNEQEKVQMAEEEWSEFMGKYKNQERHQLEQVLGKEDTRYWRQVIQRKLKDSDTGMALVEEFKNSKLLHSANFFGLLVELLGSSADLSDEKKEPPHLKMNDEQLREKETKLYARKELSEEYKNGTAAQRKLYRKYYNTLRNIQREMSNRGLL